MYVYIYFLQILIKPLMQTRSINIQVSKLRMAHVSIHKVLKCSYRLIYMSLSSTHANGLIYFSADCEF